MAGKGKIEVTFGQKVRKLREAKGLGLRAFSKSIGVSNVYLSKFERGLYPPPAEDKVKAIARELELDPDELLALAGRVSSDLVEIIQNNPKGTTALLRKFKDISNEEVQLLAKVQKSKD